MLLPSVYFDTAFVVKCYVPEEGSEEVRGLAARVDQLFTSELTRAEFAAALHRKYREKSMSRRDVTTVMTQFDADCEVRIWTFIPVSTPVLQRVVSAFATLPNNVPLRAADAIHCASAAELGLDRIYSNDRHLLQATTFFRLKGVDLVATAAVHEGGPG